MGKEISKNENLPAEFIDLIEQDSGVGQENMGADDFAIPRLAIIQPLSPQQDSEEPKYIEGAKQSMIFDNINEQLYDGEKGIIVVPVSYRRTILEWTLREKDGGTLVQDHGLELGLLRDCRKDDKNRMINADGNQLTETLEYFVFNIDVENQMFSPCMISMASTQIKVGKRWNALIDQIRINNNGKRIKPPIFYMSYQLTTIPQRNDQGKWYIWDVKKNGSIFGFKNDFGSEIYHASKEFHSQIMSGDVKVARESEDTTVDEESPM